MSGLVQIAFLIAGVIALAVVMRGIISVALRRTRDTRSAPGPDQTHNHHSGRTAAGVVVADDEARREEVDSDTVAPEDEEEEGHPAGCPVSDPESFRSDRKVAGGGPQRESSVRPNTSRSATGETPGHPGRSRQHVVSSDVASSDRTEERSASTGGGSRGKARRNQPDESLKEIDRATESTRRNYERMRRRGPVPLGDLEQSVAKDLTAEPRPGAGAWFGYRNFSEFAVQALPNTDFEDGTESTLSARRDSTEDDMLPLIRWLWLNTDRRFPRLQHDQWRALLGALGEVNQKARWLGSPNSAERGTLIAKAMAKTRRDFDGDLNRTSFEYVVSLMANSRSLSSGLRVHEFAGRFIDEARSMGANSGLPNLEFERMEAWIWGYERAADETLGESI